MHDLRPLQGSEAGAGSQGAPCHLLVLLQPLPELVFFPTSSSSSIPFTFRLCCLHTPVPLWPCSLALQRLGSSSSWLAKAGRPQLCIHLQKQPEKGPVCHPLWSGQWRQCQQKEPSVPIACVARQWQKASKLKTQSSASCWVHLKR